jgi:hypothetical protein
MKQGEQNTCTLPLLAQNAERRRQLKTPGPSVAMCPVEPFNTAFATLKQKKIFWNKKLALP